jgi:hypothetical protein
LLLALVILLAATTLEATIADSKIYRLSMTEQIDQFFHPNGILISISVKTTPLIAKFHDDTAAL